MNTSYITHKSPRLFVLERKARLAGTLPLAAARVVQSGKVCATRTEQVWSKYSISYERTTRRMNLGSSDLLKRISTEFTLSYVEQDWGIENASNTSTSKAFLVLDRYLGQDMYVDRQIIDLLFESANESLLEGSLRPEEEKRLRLMIGSDEFKTKYTGALTYWSELNPGEFPIANIIRTPHPAAASLPGPTLK